MKIIKSYKILYLLGLLFFVGNIFAQSSSLELTAAIETNNSKANLLEILVAVQNNSTDFFEGSLKVNLPKGIKSISENSINLQLKSNEKQFVSLKLWVQKDVASGNADMQIQVLNNQKNIVVSKDVIYVVPENNQLRLAAENPIIYYNTPNDSIRIKTLVSNLGNKTQAVTLVIKIPELVGETNFFELKGKVQVQKDSTFIFSFLPNKKLLKLQQFNVQISGFRGIEKELFGNATIFIQNIGSTQQFIHSENQVWSNFNQKNSVIASYRNFGNNSNIYQIQGSAEVDLPAGFISLKGILYKSTNEDQAVLNNASISYLLNNHQLTVGNISKPFEMSLFGRGISFSSSDSSKNKTFEIGFIDQQFNFIQKNAFLNSGYGFYAHGVLGASNYSKNYLGTYIFKNDPFEQVKHHVLSSEITHEFNPKWRTNIKLSGGLSNYDLIKENKASFASEFQYNGAIKQYKFFGNFFISSDYFPGNRRGIMQMQQHIDKDLNNGNQILANYFYSNFSPKSYAYTSFLESNNMRFDIGHRWKKSKNFGFAWFYQLQHETSTNYNSGLLLNNDVLLKLITHRLVENINWTSDDSKHLINWDFENGWAKYPFSSNWKFQGKTQISYSFKALNINASYQKGSYNLSEFFSSYRLDPNANFHRFMTSIAYQGEWFHKKLNASLGVSYSDDTMIGKAPSFFSNFIYNPNDLFQVFLNSSWFKYNDNQTGANLHFQNNLISIEVGLRLNFNRKNPSTGKKSTIHAKVFYDKNTNNIFDEEDEWAGNYLTVLNNTSFKTDAEGNLIYKSVPFGNYTIQPMVQNGWYPALLQYDVSKYKTNVEVPLHQNGILSGKIMYDFDPKLIVDFEPKLAGITFIVFKENKQIQRIVTNESGQFTAFLPTGNYEVLLDDKSLPEHAYCENKNSSIQISSGKTLKMPSFVIKVKQKKINIKRFGE